jgi:hypothetical protein
MNYINRSLLLAILLLSCEPNGSKNFNINNNLPYPIVIRITFRSATPTSKHITIQSDSLKSIYSYFEASNNITGIEIQRYFDSLQVYHNDSLIYCQCPTNADYWKDTMINYFETLTLDIDTILLNQK